MLRRGDCDTRGTYTKQRNVILIGLHLAAKQKHEFFRELTNINREVITCKKSNNNVTFPLFQKINQ